MVAHCDLKRRISFSNIFLAGNKYQQGAASRLSNYNAVTSQENIVNNTLYIVGYCRLHIRCLN
jgi:hypothetical protein